jgi:acetyltransferase-like isoleucine patch superfamily enzyme
MKKLVQSLKIALQLISTPFPSPIRVALYRLLGARIMDGATIKAFSIVLVKNLIMEPRARIRPFVVIVYPELLHLKAYSGISYFALIHGKASLKVGVHSHISIFNFVDLHDNVRLGNWSSPSAFCKIMTHGVYWPASWGYSTKFAPVEMGDFVWIHFNCNIGAGVTIASNNVILSGSTIVSPIRKSGYITYDNSIKKRRIPISIMRNTIGNENNKNFIIDCAKEWAHHKYNNSQLEILDDNNSLIIKNNGKPHLQISIVRKSEEINNNIPQWLWGYKLSDSEFNSNWETLDFFRILCSDKPSKLHKDALGYLRKRWGIRAGEFKYRDYCEIPPPIIEHEK